MRVYCQITILDCSHMADAQEMCWSAVSCGNSQMCRVSGCTGNWTFFRRWQSDKEKKCEKTGTNRMAIFFDCVSTTNRLWQTVTNRGGEWGGGGARSKKWLCPQTRFMEPALSVRTCKNEWKAVQTRPRQKVCCTLLPGGLKVTNWVSIVVETISAIFWTVDSYYQ